MMSEEKKKLKELLDLVREETGETETKLLSFLCGKYMLASCNDKDIADALKRLRKTYPDIVEDYEAENEPAEQETAPAQSMYNMREEVYRLATRLARRSMTSGSAIISKILGGEKTFSGLTEEEVKKLKAVLPVMIDKMDEYTETAEGQEITTLADAGFVYYYPGREVCEKCLYSIAPALRGYDFDCPPMAKLAGTEKYAVPDKGHCKIFEWRFGNSKQRRS